MAASRRSLWSVTAVLLLAAGMGSMAIYRSRAGTRALQNEPFHASDLALIGHTGLPQLVEFYHPG